VRQPAVAREDLAQVAGQDERAVRGIGRLQSVVEQPQRRDAPVVAARAPSEAHARAVLRRHDIDLDLRGGQGIRVQAQRGARAQSRALLPHVVEALDRDLLVHVAAPNDRGRSALRVRIRGERAARAQVLQRESARRGVQRERPRGGLQPDRLDHAFARTQGTQRDLGRGERLGIPVLGRNGAAVDPHARRPIVDEAAPVTLAVEQPDVQAVVAALRRGRHDQEPRPVDDRRARAPNARREARLVIVLRRDRARGAVGLLGLEVDEDRQVLRRGLGSCVHEAQHVRERIAGPHVRRVEFGAEELRHERGRRRRNDRCERSRIRARIAQVPADRRGGDADERQRRGEAHRGRQSMGDLAHATRLRAPPRERVGAGSTGTDRR